MFKPFIDTLLTRLNVPGFRLPDFCIGGNENPQVRRWHVIPHNQFFNIYLHHFLRDDSDEVLHDHPWHSLSIILKGGYYEMVPGHDPCIQIAEWRHPGDFAFRRAEFPHRIVLEDWYSFSRFLYGPGINGFEKLYGEYKTHAWTLFITGPKIREWGFHCPKGWVHWKDFTSPTDSGLVGKGCDQELAFSS